MNRKIKISILAISIAIFAILIFFAVKKNNETAQKECKIGFITDVHGRKSTKGTERLKEESEKTLLAFSKRMKNDFHPNFIVDGGDLIEGTDREGQKSIDDFKALKEYLEKMDIPLYHVIGNHETRGFSKDDWLKLVDQEKTFYYFDHKNLRIIVLDGNENERIDTSAPDYNKDFYYITDEQFAFLEKTLSENENLQKIVFIHYPPFETPGTKMINPEQSARLREIFSKNKVAAVFSGHTEILDYKEIEGVRYFVIPGAERSELKNVHWLGTFSEITVGEDVKAKIFYKKSFDEENYHELLIPSEEYENIEK